VEIDVDEALDKVLLVDGAFTIGDTGVLAVDKLEEAVKESLVLVEKAVEELVALLLLLLDETLVELGPKISVCAPGEYPHAEL